MNTIPSIAIIGASAQRDKYGNKAVRAYLSAGWDVYPVNPKEKEIEGLNVYSTVEEIFEPVEVASLYVPPAVAVKLVEGMVEKGIKEVYVNPGTESEELLQALHKAGIQAIVACSIVAIGEDPHLL